MSDTVVSTSTVPARVNIHSTRSHGALDADIIIKNAPDPVFVSDLEGKILSANHAVYELFGFHTDEVFEHSLSRFISPEETREFTAAPREVIERGGSRNARLKPRSAFFFNDTASSEIYALSLHDALPISVPARVNILSTRSHGALDSDSLIKNAPDPVFVSDLEGKILQ